MSDGRISLARRLALIPGKLRERGLVWFLRRSSDILLGSIGIQRAATRLANAVLRAPIKIVPGAGAFAKGILVVWYDLTVYPISYDICWFLVLADLERKRQGFSRMHFVFLPIDDHKSRAYPPGYDAVVDLTSRRWRFQNICTPMLALAPACGGFTVCNARDQGKSLNLMARRCWPSPNLFSNHPPLSVIYRDLAARLSRVEGEWGLKAPEQGLRYLQRWLAERARGRKPVVVTLRQYAVDVERNSRVEDWTGFLKGLDDTLYFPILVPDTDHAVEINESFEGLTLFPEAAWNAGLRMALYESAYINMFVNSGPASLCILNSRCRYLLFKLTVPGVHLASERILREMGFETGTTPPFATPLQKWVWEDDTVDVLTQEFHAMVERIEGAEDRSAAVAAPRG